MTKKLATLLLAVCVTVWALGCSVSTTGSASWEMYGGFRTIQDSEVPSKAELKFSVVDAIIDSLSDCEVSEAE